VSSLAIGLDGTMVRLDPKFHTVGHDHGVGDVRAGAVDKRRPHVAGTVELGDGVQGVGPTRI